MKIANLLLLIVVLAALLAGCDNGPQPVVTATPAPVPTALVAATPSTVPTSPPAIATETACTTPTVTGKLNLLPLPGIVRGPAGMAMFQGHLYVAGSRSNNVGVIENGQLTSVFATGSGPSALLADEAMGKLFVLNADALSVSMSDGQKVQATIPISNTALAQLHQEAREMVIDTQRHRLYVGINTSRPEIAVIDTQAFTISARIVFTGSHGMGPMALDAANNRLFFAHSDASSSYISVLDLQTRKITEKITVGTGPHNLVLYDATSHRLYADYTDRNPGYHVVVLENGKQIASAVVAQVPDNALIVNQRLYMPNVYSNTVDVVDLQTGQPVASIDVGLYPIALFADPGGERIYVTVYGIINNAPESNRIEIIDTRRNEVTGLIPLAATTPQMIGDVTRNRLYVLLPSSSEVAISDGQRILSRVKLERAPFQMALDERAGRLYVGDELAHIISVIDVSSGLVVARVIPTLRADQSGSPTYMYALAVDTQRNRLLVNNAFFSLDQLRATGSYTITGTSIGEPSWAAHWFTSPVLPRYYAIFGTGLSQSRRLIAHDSETLKSQDSGIANVTALALDDGAQRLYAASTLLLTLTSTEDRLHVLAASTLNPIAQLSMPARVTTMALNAKTHHLFLAYRGDVVHPSAADDSVEILETNRFGRVGTFRVAAEPNAMAVLGDYVYIASSTAADLTIVRDCMLAESPPAATSTPLPTPSPAPTTTPIPTLTGARPTPVKPSTTSLCVPPPAATPPWTVAQLPLPKLPVQSAVMFSYYVSNAACLAALDAQGGRAWSAIISPIDTWHFDARARMLWVLARGADGRSTYLYWNRVGADGDGQQLQKAPEREVSGFVFSPDGTELLYAEQDRLDPPRSFAVSWQLVRLELATKQKRIVLTGQYNFATPQPSRPFSGDMTKVPFGWSGQTGRIYLYEPSAAGNAHMVALWSVNSGGTDLQRLGADTNIERPALSPDEQRVAYLTIDPDSPTKSIDVTFPPELNQLKVLDVASGATVVNLSEHGDGIFSGRLLWTSDSRALLVGRSRDGQGDYVNPTLQEWLVVTSEDAGVKTWLNLDRAHEEFVDDLAACASGEIAYALNRDRQTTGIVLDDLKGHARTIADVPGGWGSTRLVGCFK